MSTRIELQSPDGIGEIRPGDDLAVVASQALGDLRDGDIVVITSKIVSKAEGRVRRGDRDSALAEETQRVVARRGLTTIVRNRLGLTMAAAGIDASNVEAGTIVLLPIDPDASARVLRARLRELRGVNVGVVITDTSGRTWRHGQTDIAIGAAGLRVADDFNGRTDAYGNPLKVTLTAVIDEIASAAELAQGKLAARPVALLRGRADLVAAPAEEPPGAATLIREEGTDLFGYGAREAVLRAVAGREADRTPFGAPVPLTELQTAFTSAFGDLVALDGDDAAAQLAAVPNTSAVAVAAVLFAHGWRSDSPMSDTASGIRASIQPVDP